VVGRHVGWIATHAGIAGGADVILVPEEPADLDQVAEQLRRRHAGGTSFSIVVVAEGTKIRSRPDEPEHVISSGAVDEAGRVRLGGGGGHRGGGGGEGARGRGPGARPGGSPPGGAPAPPALGRGAPPPARTRYA